MKSEFLKIAGVKTEKEFYKKFPNEETFMKKHGKAVKSLMAKKAQVGTMIPNIQSNQSNLKPIKIGDEFLYNSVADLTGGDSYDEMMKKMQNQAMMQSLQNNNNQNKNGLGSLSSIIEGGMELFGDNAKYGGDYKKAQFGQKVNDFYNSSGVQDWGIPIIGDAINISNQFKAQKDDLNQARQSRMVSEVALRAANTQPERIERQYVRPEDIENTGEEFFPIYGVGTNALAKDGIEVQNTYAPNTLYTDLEYTPLVNVNQQKAFANGGYLTQAKGGFSYGGGAAGGLGSKAGQMFGFGNDAGGQVGGKIGGTIGSAFGPIGSAVGSFIGSGIGDLLDRDDRRIRIENEKAERLNKELAYTAVAPAIQAGYASHVRNGGNINPQVITELGNNKLSNLLKPDPTMNTLRSGGNLRGNYVPPNPSALDTMAMGGEIKTLWGGDIETVSYNPYAGGESIEFKGNSHDYRDPKTGQTGIGVAYGEQSVANNSPVVEVENEPAQKLRDGGGDENLVVYGDLKIPEEYIGEINDNRAKNMKFKNYVSNVLNKDEAKINKKMEKAADKGLESDNTIWGQLERSTANAIIDGGDKKLESIAEKKNILADLQSALNDTFDEFAIKGNEFINKNKVVEDPEKIETAKDGAKVEKAQYGLDDISKFGEDIDLGTMKEMFKLPNTEKWEAPVFSTAMPRNQDPYNMLETKNNGIETKNNGIDSNLINAATLAMQNFLPRRENEALDANQLLAEQYAMATNQVQPVYAQTFSPRLSVPFDVSYQDRMNEIISQNRAMLRNPAIQGNPAAQALMGAPMYEAINKVKAEEFRANQEMRNNAYLQNLDAANKSDLVNLGVYDKQQDRLADAASKTRTQNIDILSSISDKYAQKRLENRLERVYENMYPTFGFDRNFQTQVQRGTNFNIPGLGSVGRFPWQTPGFNPNAKEEEGKEGKTIKKNNKNSNVLKTLRNL
jgi:hypothetical protein